MSPFKSKEQEEFLRKNKPELYEKILKGELKPSGKKQEIKNPYKKPKRQY